MKQSTFQTKRDVLFKEIILLYCVNHVKFISIMCTQNGELK